jgi:alpha-tubulin suppressor-like RCC1 family protein
MAIDGRGVVFTFGKGSDGQLGLSDPPLDSLIPVPIPKVYFENDIVINVSAGYYHSAAITSKGKLFTWGWGEHGQLGMSWERSHLFS